MAIEGASQPETADQPDWPTQAADSVVRLVGDVRAKTTRPAILVSRVVVYGVVLAIGGVTLLVLSLVMVFRALEAVPGPLYWWYLGIGAALCLAGIGLWSKRKQPAEQ